MSRTPPDNQFQTAIAFPPQEYNVTKGVVDHAGRTRTWALRDTHGTKMAQVTTKCGALKIRDMLNEAETVKHSAHER